LAERYDTSRPPSERRAAFDSYVRDYVDESRPLIAENGIR